LLFYM
jgi:hypothetical protein